MTFNSLQTLVIEIEAVLNDHPLTYVPTDINDPDPITPAHLLYDRKIVCIPYRITPQHNQCDPDFGALERQKSSQEPRNKQPCFNTFGPDGEMNI